jgi:hypothetical protein
MLSMTILRILALLGFTAISACNLAPASSTEWPTATTVQVNRSSPVPTLNRELHAISTPEPSATALSNCALPEAADTRTQYTIVADVDYARHHVSVQQTVRFVNTTGAELSRLVFTVEPNHWLDVFKLNAVKTGGEDASYELTGRRLTVNLPSTLMPGCEITTELAFHLAVPPVGEGVSGYDGYFGYTERQFNLGHWLPTVAVYAGGEWVIHESVMIGEQDVLVPANWDVTLHMTNAAETIQVAAPGEMTRVNDSMWRFILPAARDFTISMSEQFTLERQETEGGVSVELYSFDSTGEHAATNPSAVAASLDAAVRSLAMYEDLFGAYPYSRMIVVEGDFPDGMEFTGLVFVSGDWFHRYDGTPAGYLVVITVHEVSHQWWYARVGNDSALYPWLDESLATYCEYIFIEEYYPELKDWWWQWRVNRLSPQGYVDSTVYEFATIREYINAVYLRGVLLLHDLRQALGTEAFFDILRRYSDAGAGQLVTPDLFWSQFTPEQLEQTLNVRRRYLRQPLVGGQ